VNEAHWRIFLSVLSLWSFELELYVLILRDVCIHMHKTFLYALITRVFIWHASFDLHCRRPFVHFAPSGRLFFLSPNCFILLHLCICQDMCWYSILKVCCNVSKDSNYVLVYKRGHTDIQCTWLLIRLISAQAWQQAGHHYLCVTHLSHYWNFDWVEKVDYQRESKQLDL